MLVNSKYILLKKKKYKSIFSSIQKASDYFLDNDLNWTRIFNINHSINYKLTLNGFNSNETFLANYITNVYNINTNYLLMDKQQLENLKKLNVDTTRFSYVFFFKEKTDYCIFLNFLNKTLLGLSYGYKKTISLVNINYKIYIDAYKRLLTVFIGKSHGNTFKFDKNIYVIFKKKKKLLYLISYNKYLIGSLAAKIKKLRPISKYKNKGIKYQDEIIKFKEGKTKQR